MAEGAVAGVDWAKDAHEVLVADSEGERLWGETVPHDEVGIARLCRTLVTLDVVRVAVERPDGLPIERLLDAGLTVLAIHPNMVAAARDRFRAAGGKSDRFDAFVLYELARTDSHRFRALSPDSDQTKGLRALTRGREVLVEQRVALCDQLRAELERFWPGAVEIFRDLDSPISLAFLERYPSPTDARSAPSASGSSSPATTTADARTPPSCSASSATPRPAALRAADLSSRSSPPSNRSSSRSACSPARSATPSARTPTDRSSCRSSKARTA